MLKIEMSIINPLPIIALAGAFISLPVSFATAQSKTQSKAYTVHEWGTFTTVSGSDGILLSGLQREEEYLPRFVHGHTTVRHDGGGKGFRFPVRGVTVKMETPVIYFYGAPQDKVNVKVGFNGGAISQWFPDRTNGEVAPKIEPLPHKATIEKRIEWQNKMLAKTVDFTKYYQGSIEWDAQILTRSEVDPIEYYKPEESRSWIYPAVPESNIVKVADTYEQYLFYRGIGNFTLPVKFTIDESETLSITNNGAEKVSFAFVFEKTADGSSRYKALHSGIDPSVVQTIKESEMINLPDKDMVKIVFKEMRKGLIAQGLTKNEANGMIKTWWRSYFGHEGLRVFWVVPRQETERILPLQITPRPESITRVIVGRSEVLRPRFEKEMLALTDKFFHNRYSHQRFGLSYRERLKTLRTEAEAAPKN